MKLLRFLPLVLFAACNPPARPGEAGACPMSDVKSLDYCPGCYKFCPPGTVENNTCNKCTKAVTKADACVATFYYCKKHGDHSKPCADNAGESCCEKRADTAAVEWRCGNPKCPRWSTLQATCPANACPNFGKPMVKVCSASGSFPHGGSEPRPYKPQ